MDPLALWLSEQGVDVLAASEAFALVCLIAVVWFGALAIVKALES